MIGTLLTEEILRAMYYVSSYVLHIRHIKGLNKNNVAFGKNLISFTDNR